MSAPNPLSPLNDFTRHVLCEQVDNAGVTQPITSGTITGFLSNSATPDATAFDASWSVTGTYIGGANSFDAGTWQFAIDAAVITKALCESAGFAAGTVPYFIVTRDNAFRAVEKLKYVASRLATVA